MRRALGLVRGFGIEVRIVSYGVPAREVVAIAEEFGG
jgi:hypothetical protein